MPTPDQQNVSSQQVLGGFILGAAAQTVEGNCGASLELLEAQLESRGPKPPLSPIEGGFDDSEDAQNFEELYQWAANISGQVSALLPASASCCNCWSAIRCVQNADRRSTALTLLTIRWEHAKPSSQASENNCPIQDPTVDAQ